MKVVGEWAGQTKLTFIAEDPEPDFVIIKKITLVVMKRIILSIKIALRFASCSTDRSFL